VAINEINSAFEVFPSMNGRKVRIRTVSISTKPGLQTSEAPRPLQ